MTDDAESVLQIMRDGWYLDVPADNSVSPTVFITGEADASGLFPLDVKNVPVSVVDELLKSGEVEEAWRWEPPERDAIIYRVCQ